FFTILVDHIDSETEAYDHKINRNARRREGSDPSALAAALESDAACPRSSETTSLAQSGGRLVSEHGVILSVLTLRSAGPALVIDKDADALCGQKSLKEVESSRRRILCTVDQDDYRNRLLAFWKDQSSCKFHVPTSEVRLGHLQGDAMTWNAFKRDAAS